MMVLAVNLENRFLLFLLCSSVYNLTLALNDSESIIGSNVPIASNVSNNNRFYLNTARPSPCNGTIKHLRYCYYGREDSDSNTYQALVALYRPEPGSDNYRRTTNTVSIIKQLPPSQEAPLTDTLLPGFNCDSMELEESVQVLLGDVIGACIYAMSSIHRLDVVSLNNTTGYRMLYNSADDEDCEDRVLPDIVGRGLKQINRLRILHIFAEIFPADVTTTATTVTISTGTTAATAMTDLKTLITTAAGSIIAGIVLGALIIIVALVVIIFVYTRKQIRKCSLTKGAPRLPRRSHRTLFSNLISEHNEAEVHTMRPYQNFACPYERAECTAFRGNETHGNTVTSQVPPPSIERQRNYHYETDSQYNPPRSVYHVYFTLEGSDYPYDELIEKNKAQDLYASVRQFSEPAREEEDLYAQIKSYGIRNVTRSSIQITGHLGSGQFGSVKEGTWTTDGCSVKVALKTLNQDTTKENKVKFLQEAAIMAQFRHPNIVLLYGMVSKEEPITLVVQLVEKGDLRNYLMTIKPNPGELPAPNLPNLLLDFCQHVALGMQYLSGKGFVHRDLAARNILVSKGNLCKIADFGLSRDLANENYYISKGGMIPIKWTAPEAIEEKKYSTASDVWSYGCLLYEIWSLGHKPYDQFSNIEAIRFVKKGKRLSPPPGCPEAIYGLMIQCWNPTRSERPNFRSIHLRLLENEQDVLSIPQEALDTHQLAGVLGSPLKAGERMYEDLQTKYIEVEYYAII